MLHVWGMQKAVKGGRKVEKPRTDFWLLLNCIPKIASGFLIK